MGERGPPQRPHGPILAHRAGRERAWCSATACASGYLVCPHFSSPHLVESARLGRRGPGTKPRLRCPAQSLRRRTLRQLGRGVLRKRASQRRPGMSLPPVSVLLDKDVGNRSCPSPTPLGAGGAWPGALMTRHNILFLAANPGGMDPRALDREARSSRVELKGSGYPDRFEFQTRWAVVAYRLVL